MWVRLLGPIEAQVAGSPARLGGHRQRAVLARLLAAGGEVVSVDRLIEDLWQGAPPPRALTSLRAYVSNLRRVLEPGGSARARSRTLVSVSPGYAIRLPDDAVDAWRFERLVRVARAADPAAARALLEKALGLWRGEAYAEFADEPWSLPEAARLAGLKLDAREGLIDATLRLGDHADAVPMAEALTGEQPLREQGWRLLGLALWAGGRQAEALVALRRAREILAEETGLDPGPALVELEEAILNQRMDMLSTVVGTAATGSAAVAPHAVSRRRAAREAVREAVAPGSADPARTVAGPVAPESAAPGRTAAGPVTARDSGTALGDPQDLFVGRDAELAALTEAAAQARAGAARTVLLTGDAGAGKSALLGRLERRLVADGWQVAVGRCPEVEGAPPAWAWVEVLRGLVARVEGGDPEGRLAPLLAERPAATGQDVAAGRFLLHRAVCDWLRAAAGTGPLAIVLDDLHVADAETLALLAAVAVDAGEGMLLVAAYRQAEVGDRLRDTLAVLARNAPLRITLSGLAAAEVTEVVHAICGEPVDAATMAALVRRTEGNPFYVRESARLLASEGALVATSEVPEGVRDVLRRRLARLPRSAVGVLRLVAVAGREADVDLVVAAADTDEAGVMEALEEGLAAGLLVEPAPGRVRFTHVLVRDTLYQDLSGLRRSRMHTRYAAAIEELRPGDLPALAHHCVRAASAATAQRAVDHAVRAAELAERRYAHDAEVDLLNRALEVCPLIPAGSADQDEVRVDLLGRLLRAQARAGATLAAQLTQDRAVDVAERAGRDDLLIAAFTAQTVPTTWERRAYGRVDGRAVHLLGRLLGSEDLAPAVRCRLLHALTNELEVSDPAALAAGEEAVTLARETGDPGLLAQALTARSRTLVAEHDQTPRRLIGLELIRLGAEYAMPSYEWVGVHLSACYACLHNDPEALRKHHARATEISATYQLGEPQAIDLGRAGMVAHIAGRFEEAARCYLRAADRLSQDGSPHADGYRVVGQMTLWLGQGRLAEHEPEIQSLRREYEPFVLDPLALVLAQRGRVEEARRLRAGVLPIRRDHFATIFATMRAKVAQAVGAHDEAAEIHQMLLPERDRLAGAVTGSLVLHPVAQTLGELDLFLGRRADAVEHFVRALEIARIWAAPHWTAQARAALDQARAVS